MSIIKRKINHNFTAMNNQPVNNIELSWKAKGILWYLLSKPDDWQIYYKDLVNHASDGKSAVTTGMDELIDKQYIQRTKKHNSSGKFEYEYIVTDFISPDTDLPVLVKPGTVKPGTVNRTLLSNKELNTKRLNTEQLIIHQKNKRVFDLFEQHFGRLLGTGERDIIISWLEEYGSNIELYEAVVLQGEISGKSGIHWYGSVLYNWIKKDCKSIDEIKQSQEQAVGSDYVPEPIDQVYHNWSDKQN